MSCSVGRLWYLFRFCSCRSFYRLETTCLVSLVRVFCTFERVMAGEGWPKLKN